MKNNKINLEKKKKGTLWLVNREKEADLDSDSQKITQTQMRRTDNLEGFLLA